EVKLFVIKRIVGNVHFAVKSPELTVGVEDGRSVVVDAGSALFEQGSDQYDSQLFHDICELGGGGAGNRFCEIKERGVLTLAQVLSLKKLGKADNLRAT